MTRPTRDRPTAKTERLETRLTSEQKELFEDAAHVTGRTVTDFVLSSAAKEARRVLIEDRLLTLTASDSAAFAEAILAPPDPSERLRKAAANYVESAAVS